MLLLPSLYLIRHHLMGLHLRLRKISRNLLRHIYFVFSHRLLPKIFSIAWSWRRYSTCLARVISRPRRCSGSFQSKSTGQRTCQMRVFCLGIMSFEELKSRFVSARTTGGGTP